MSSILIKFTDHKYVSDFLDGNLYMSSLGKFWNIYNNFSDQKDIFEGVCAVTGIGKNAPFPDDFLSVMASDFRFRIEAYQYCNLLCFYRVDRDDVSHIMQSIPKKMDKFGDSVLVIKNRGEFIKRIKASVIKAGGICCMGDVNYHRNAGEKRRTGMYLLTEEGEDADGTYSFDSVDQFGSIKVEAEKRKTPVCLEKTSRQTSGDCTEKWQGCVAGDDRTGSGKETEVKKRSLRHIFECWRLLSIVKK